MEDPEWLARRLEIEDAAGLAAHARAQQLVYMRRYAAKLGYELRLHGDGFSGLEEAGAGYASALSDALEVRWPAATFLTDVDPGESRLLPARLGARVAPAADAARALRARLVRRARGG